VGSCIQTKTTIIQRRTVAASHWHHHGSARLTLGPVGDAGGGGWVKFDA
jgi:hypothetical protein